MDIFIYSDESGVFDVEHNRYYVFGGVMFLGKDAKDVCARKFTVAERVVREKMQLAQGAEVKASVIRVCF